MNNLQANICLLAVTLCWSCEVILISVLPEGLNPFAMTCTTSLIGALLLHACFARRIAAVYRSDGLKIARRIVLLGLLNASYNVLIEMGLEYFDVSTGAFTLSMVAVVLPVMLFVMRRGVTLRTWVSALMVLAGVLITSYPVYSTIHPMGLVTMLSSCIIRALFIVKLSDYAREHDPVMLAAGMSSVNAVVTFIPWCTMQPLTFATLPWSPGMIAVFFIYSYFIVAFATVMNAFAQRRATPAQATIIYATEIVFSIIWATCLPDSIIDSVDITLPMTVGCIFVVLGNVVEIIPIGKRRRELAAEDAAIGADKDLKAKESAAIEGDSTADLVTHILLRLKHPMARMAVLFVILLAVYMIIAMPFKVLSIIPGFTDIRPVCMLQPVYGIFFGLPGCLAFAIGNVISDIFSDSLRWTSIAGFIGNFMTPFLLYLYWMKLRKKPFNLRTRRVLAGMVASIIVCALIQAAIIAPAVAIIYPEVDIMVFTVSVIVNSSVFSIAFAIPFIILIQEELSFEPLAKKFLEKR